MVAVRGGVVLVRVLVRVVRRASGSGSGVWSGVVWARKAALQPVLTPRVGRPRGVVARGGPARRRRSRAARAGGGRRTQGAAGSWSRGRVWVGRVKRVVCRPRAMATRVVGVAGVVGAAGVVGVVGVVAMRREG
jgi:hypothetical protein